MMAEVFQNPIIYHSNLSIKGDHKGQIYLQEFSRIFLILFSTQKCIATPLLSECTATSLPTELSPRYRGPGLSDAIRSLTLKTRPLLRSRASITAEVKNFTLNPIISVESESSSASSIYRFSSRNSGNHRIGINEK
jgi:hypothetical protein